MAVPKTLYVVSAFTWDDDERQEGVREPEVYSSKDAANKAAKEMMNRLADVLNPYGERDDFEFHHNLDEDGLYRGNLEGGPHGHVAVEMCVYKVTLNQASTRKTSKGPLNGPDNWMESGDGEGENDNEETDEQEDPAEESKPSSKTSAAKSKASTAAKGKGKKATSGSETAAKVVSSRKSIPAGLPNCLEGIKILFTGTFETMDRKTSVATAEKYGADVVTKLEDTDYIVIGQRAGPKKLQTINELELETISEEEFFDILENGVSQDKKERMANKRKADEAEVLEGRPGKAQKKGGARKATN